ncbi:RagB/SusD family nutrient uptake outer membrane protein [Pontibacter sp. 172403-2]|uniref:RagB/SusD family nutrient uptake outer membrane protein n=1 Tax=Pontibacter rufus TaxID=2791028 RepID=UPI0018AF8C20|nr:RagB/SusD family nutrient uptake outer membrane protein [Pontibacter sp. 172403-2]MBF9251784.1 RagB/SusD family nutrient uptake outer membrane protein [Pontibacter sp. 172403-2]
MTNIKKISSILFIGLLLISMVSCDKDFLENTDLSKLNDDTQWASDANADLFLNDIYGSLPNKWNQPENLDNFTDDNDAGFYYTSWNWKQGIIEPSSSNYTVWGGITGPADLTNWPTTYTNIRKCNTFIQKVNENAANFSPEWMKKRLDEARFLRAYFYSELWMHLGGLPIITEAMDRRTMDSTQIYKSRSTFEVTTDFITSQLDSIINNNTLAVKYNAGDANAGRATLGAALALKGWVELYAASPAFNAPQPAAGADANKVAGYGSYDAGRWAKAAATFKEFIDKYGDGHPYALFSDLSALWYEGNEYNPEVVWDRQVVANTMGSSFEQFGGPVWINGVYYTWGNYDPTQELVDQFFMANGKPITDPASGYDPQNPYVGREERFYDWIVYDGAPYKMDWMSIADTIYTRIDKVHPSKNQIDFGTDDVGNTGYYFKKKLNPLVRPGGGPVSGANFIYYRYAEVLLGYAEAQNEAVGPDPSVYNAINSVRHRADLPDLPAGLSQDEMRKAIHHERRVELCFENKRFYDIIRWKVAEDVMNKERHGMKITNSSPADNKGVWIYEPVPLNHPHVFTQKMYLNPVPQAVIDQNPEIVQNPGY